MGAYNLNGTPLSGGSFSFISNTTVNMSILVDCITDYIIKGYPVADVVIRAKHTAGAYVDIENNPISLTPWNGTQQQFDFEFQVGNISVHRRELILFDIIPNA
jgi:hypothetical protein